MPEWFTGAAALVAALSALWAVIQGKRKANAEANGVVVKSYKALVDDLCRQGERKDLKIQLLEEKIKNVTEERDLLHDEKVHATTFLTIATARLSAYENQELTNSEAENEPN